MPPDPQRVEETRAWFAKASEDLRAAAFEMTAEPPLLFDVVFHAQQAAEKAMKGFLTWHDVPFRKTHDLAEIGRQVIALDPAFEGLSKRAIDLSVYAWVFRYPGDPDEPTAAEGRDALGLAQDVYEALLRGLPSAART